jgi:hypothetical protein
MARWVSCIWDPGVEAGVQREPTALVFSVLKGIHTVENIVPLFRADKTAVESERQYPIRIGGFGYCVLALVANVKIRLSS